MFSKVLIANRGEIACRVIRTCRRLGIKTAAIYSDADAEAAHVKLADEAHHIGASPPAESYLNIQKIVSVAHTTGAEAIHPGYGFLAENPAFSEAVINAGIVFIGPSPEAKRALGTKTGARQLVEQDGVPTVPWRRFSSNDFRTVEDTVNEFGLPVVVKPSAGGGGIGTSIVRRPEELQHAVELAASLGTRFFNQPAIHIERFIEGAKHIEVQVILDRGGRYTVFPERECSIQRRYQKVVEESPSIAISPLLRSKLGAAAVKVFQAGGYYNVGTVEFLVDKCNNFYFLEVNSRIQVEHPVTEMVTGVDVVELQLKVASGQRLTLPQDLTAANGHAVEVRVYAEDPETLLPTGGLVAEYREPSGEGVRVDSGVRKGYEVTSFYDPLLAKLITWAPTRDDAMRRMREALRDYKIEGLVTNLPLLQKVIDNPSFLSGEYYTNTLTNEIMTAKATHSAPSLLANLSNWWRFGR